MLTDEEWGRPVEDVRLEERLARLRQEEAGSQIQSEDEEAGTAGRDDVGATMGSLTMLLTQALKAQDKVCAYACAAI